MAFLNSTSAETICAVCTPPGSGGVAIIRLSGRQAFAIAQKNCSFLPENPQSHQMYYGNFLRKDQSILDDVLVAYFAEGKSFTGEQTIEINCHGNQFLCESLVNALITSGARLAERGEFSYRAFLNGRLDLVQAESIHKLIGARTDKGLRLARKHLDGQASSYFHEILAELLKLAAHFEADIDFSSEGLETMPVQIFAERTKIILNKISESLESKQKSKIIFEGAEVAVVGSPNVGKSSFLNRMLGKEKAIVSATPGTTRDIVEAEIDIDGLQFKLFDTAGIRETSDEIEKVGISKTLDFLPNADLCLLIVDDVADIQNWKIKIAELDLAEKAIVLVNKCDLRSQEYNEKIALEIRQQNLGAETLLVSALDGTGLSEVRAALKKMSVGQNDEEVLLQNRHYEELFTCQRALNKVCAQVLAEESPEFIAFELKEAIMCIQRILGIEFDDQIMDTVFNEFCLGK